MSDLINYVYNYYDLLIYIQSVSFECIGILNTFISSKSHNIFRNVILHNFNHYQTIIYVWKYVFFCFQSLSFICKFISFERQQDAILISYSKADYFLRISYIN